MSADLVARLRAEANNWVNIGPAYAALLREAADELERLIGLLSWPRQQSGTAKPGEPEQDPPGISRPWA